ncbi:uncharacterized protein LOC119403622 [Rhipicephalus sanguineus]|uniref:uncharacterized protein LOC119403622 n=1 Tax=Rhipicephalus sanguineus TaxID=34632 RepID=UPI0018937E56|nr:uncharacterized protein LOC119403622 [Rhipicephalus sanguineus]
MDDRPLKDYEGVENPELDAEFGVEEVRQALHDLNGKSAPGPDKITNKALRNLDDKSIEHLTEFINMSWSNGNVPALWKKATVILIPKPGKPPSLDNLRPISLTSCVGKVAEHAILNRLSRYLEDNDVYPHHMIGFRPGLSTQDAMKLIKNQIIDRNTRDTRAILGLDLEKPFCGGYFSHLIGSARVRYKEKIELCENVDPYTLRLGTDTSADASLLPSVAHGDIVTYLVFSTSFVTLDQMKAYKALESHNYFTSGWVKSLSAKRLGEDKVLLLGEVNHSQRLGECPLKVWVLCKQSGAVVTGHCTCMAGTGETCSHVGACLFAIETGARLNQSTTCTQKENAWLPAYVEKVKYKRLKDIDFSSSKEKKRRLDATSSGSKETKVPKQRKGISAPSPTELKELYAAFNTTVLYLLYFPCCPTIVNAFKNPFKEQLLT